MRRLLLAALPLLLAAPADAALIVGSERFEQEEVLDARALPDASGAAAILVTFTVPGARRYAKIAKAHEGRKLRFALDDRLLAEPTMGRADDEGAVQISGDFGGFDGAAAIARQISGKAPVPEEGEE